MARPYRVWSDWTYVVDRLEPIITALGRFPTQNELHARGQSSIIDAIKRHHGGMRAARAKLGYAQPRKAKGYYHAFENVRAEVEPIARELGRFPTQDEFLARGHGSLVQCVWRYHGGLEAVRWRIGLSPSHTAISRGTWKSWNRIVETLRPIIVQEGTIPLERCLRKLTGSGFVGAIHRHHGGLNEVRRRLGQTRVDDEMLHAYAQRIVDAYMTQASHNDRFELFLKILLDSALVEDDLREAIGLARLAA